MNKPDGEFVNYTYLSGCCRMKAFTLFMIQIKSMLLRLKCISKLVSSQYVTYKDEEFQQRCLDGYGTYEGSIPQEQTSADNSRCPF